MKTKTTFFAFILVPFFTFAQHSEFPIHDNGLIYTESTMNQLAHIVDSLNLKYKNCSADPVYYSTPQTVGHFILLKGEHVKAAKEDIEAGIEYEAFISKYQPKVEENILILKPSIEHFNDKWVQPFRHLSMDGFYSHEIAHRLSDDELHPPYKDKWVYNAGLASEYRSAYLEAFFFPNKFQQNRIPAKYACMIQYADCLIDTSTTKFLPGAGYGRPMDLPKNFTALPLEEKQALLEEMRLTKVTGFCSQDRSPRIHAMQIAVLSAESVNWETFLRAHLDIMNDRFERVTDGSYAWGERHTYIKELEALDIDVTALLLGTTLRISNAPTNHYFGSITRVGRALSESEKALEVEKLILEMIMDEELDDYNRILAFFLFSNYNSWTKDEAIKQRNLERLKLAAAFFPSRIEDKIDWSNW